MQKKDLQRFLFGSSELPTWQPLSVLFRTILGVQSKNRAIEIGPLENLDGFPLFFRSITNSLPMKFGSRTEGNTFSTLKNHVNRISNDHSASPEVREVPKYGIAAEAVTHSEDETAFRFFPAFTVGCSASQKSSVISVANNCWKWSSVAHELPS